MPRPLRAPTLRNPFSEYLRPWKLVTLLLGAVALIVGSVYTPAPDWDAPISIVMAVSTYLTAPYVVRAIAEGRWRSWPWAVFLAWASVDGVYSAYWYVRNPEVLEAMRDASLRASLPLYGICGVVWMLRGPLRNLSFRIQPPLDALSNPRHAVRQLAHTWGGLTWGERLHQLGQLVSRHKGGVDGGE